MPLPNIPLGWVHETIAGVPVTFHPLTVAQCQQLEQMFLLAPDSTGPQAMAWAFDVTVEEAEAWVKDVSPAVAMEVAEAVMRHSGMAAVEEAARRFPQGVHVRGGGEPGVHPGGPPEAAPVPGAGDAGP